MKKVLLLCVALVMLLGAAQAKADYSLIAMDTLPVSGNYDPGFTKWSKDVLASFTLDIAYISETQVGLKLFVADDWAYGQVKLVNQGGIYGDAASLFGSFPIFNQGHDGDIWCDAGYHGNNPVTAFETTINLAAGKTWSDLATFLDEGGKIGFHIGGTWISNFPNWKTGVVYFDIQGPGGEDQTPVPEPATLLILGLGMTGAGFVARRRKSQ